MWTIVVAGSGLAGVVLAGLLLRAWFVVVDVDGDSMQPAFATGDRVIVRRRRHGQLRVGQVVVVERPQPQRLGWAWPTGDAPIAARAWMIKRLAARPGDPVPAVVAPEVNARLGTLVPAGQLVVLGDNTFVSSDSRDFGYVPSSRVLGVVSRRLTR